MKLTTLLTALWAQITRANAPASTPRTRPPQTKRKTLGKHARRAVAPKAGMPDGQVQPYTSQDLDRKIRSTINRLESLLMRHPRAVEFECMVIRLRRLLESVE